MAIRAMLEKELHDLAMSHAGCDVQRSPVTSLLRVHEGSLVEKQSHDSDIQVTPSHCIVQRRPSLYVPNINDRTALDECHHNSPFNDAGCNGVLWSIHHVGTCWKACASTYRGDGIRIALFTHIRMNIIVSDRTNIYQYKVKSVHAQFIMLP